MPKLLKKYKDSSKLSIGIMDTQALLSNSSVAEIFSKTWYEGKIMPCDREGLMWAFLCDEIEEEEHAAIDRMLYAVKRGWIVIVNQ